MLDPKLGQFLKESAEHNYYFCKYVETATEAIMRLPELQKDHRHNVELAAKIAKELMEAQDKVARLRAANA